VEEWFKHVNGIGMCAEHGLYFVLPERLRHVDSDSGSSTVTTPARGSVADAGSKDWCCLHMDSVETDRRWTGKVHGLMQTCEMCVQGSVVENRGSSFTWNYQHAIDIELGSQLAVQLEQHLDPNGGPDSIVCGYPIKVVQGTGYIEVKRRDVDAGAAVQCVLDEIRRCIGPIDFVLYIGDGLSDEIFEAINRTSRRSISPYPGPVSEASCSNAPRSWMMTPCGSKFPGKVSMTTDEFDSVDDKMRFYRVTVGRKPLTAQHSLQDMHEVSKLLQQLASQQGTFSYCHKVHAFCESYGGDAA